MVVVVVAGGGLKYSSQCSPGRRTDTPWQLEARERHARWTRTYSIQPRNLLLPSIRGNHHLFVCLVPNGACLLLPPPPPASPRARSRFRPHRSPLEELVASVPFSKPDPIQNLRITAATPSASSLSLDLGEKDDARPRAISNLR